LPYRANHADSTREPVGHDGGGFGLSAIANWYPDAQLAVVVLPNSEPDTIAVVTEDLAAAVLPAPRQAGPFPGDASLFVGKYRGPGRGTDMVIDVTQTPQGTEFAFDGTAAAPLPWVEGSTFRRNYSVLSTDIGVSRTALHAGTSVPANTVRSATATAVTKVAGSLGATPKSNALIPRAAA